MDLRVRPYAATADLAWAEALLESELGGRLQARRGELMDPLEGSGLVVEAGGERVGLVTWHVTVTPLAQAELRVLVTVLAARGQGIGSALLDGARAELRAAGLRRAWLVTTNDNLDALGFYQRRGWRLADLRVGAVGEARRTLKPSIAEVAANGIPIRDELELELTL